MDTSSLSLQPAGRCCPIRGLDRPTYKGDDEDGRELKTGLQDITLRSIPSIHKRLRKLDTAR